jgi:hypothetical protein
MHIKKIRQNYLEVPWGCGTLEPRPNHGSQPTWHISMALRVWPRSGRGGLGNSEKNQKMEKHCMESCWVMFHLGKIPNMACQGFTGELFHKEVLPGRSSLGLLCKVTTVCASSTANYGTMVPFLVEICIFAFPPTFVTSVFLVST